MSPTLRRMLRFLWVMVGVTTMFQYVQETWTSLKELALDMGEYFKDVEDFVKHTHPAVGIWSFVLLLVRLWFAIVGFVNQIRLPDGLAIIWRMGRMAIGQGILTAAAANNVDANGNPTSLPSLVSSSSVGSPSATRVDLEAGTRHSNSTGANNNNAIQFAGANNNAIQFAVAADNNAIIQAAAGAIPPLSSTLLNLSLQGPVAPNQATLPVQVNVNSVTKVVHVTVIRGS